MPDSAEGPVSTTVRMVDFTIHDESIVMPRNGLSIELYRDDQAGALAAKHFLTGLTDMFPPIFQDMMEKGRLRQDDPAMPVFAFTAPISSLIHLCDRAPEKTEDPIAQIEAFSRHFIRVSAAAGYPQPCSHAEKIADDKGSPQIQ